LVWFLRDPTHSCDNGTLTMAVLFPTHYYLAVVLALTESSISLVTGFNTEDVSNPSLSSIGKRSLASKWTSSDEGVKCCCRIMLKFSCCSQQSLLSCFPFHCIDV
jgi:hypothetical protein